MRRVALLLTALALWASAEDLASTLKEVATYEYGGDSAAVRRLEEAAHKAAGTPHAAALEQQVLKAFSSVRTDAGTAVFARALSLIGSEASVPTLAPMLMRPATAEMARYALERIPGSASVKAVRMALPNVPSESKPGVIATLGRRNDSGAVAALKPLLNSSDSALATAAASALGMIRTPAARDALVAARPTDAVAFALLEQGQNSAGADAARIYKKLWTPRQPEAIRIAALLGLARVEPKLTTPTLISALQSESPAIQAMAIGQLAVLDRAELAKRFTELPSRAQVQAVSALINAGKADVVPVLEEALTSKDESVRVASLQGLARLGSAKHIEALANRAASSTGDEQTVARAALGGIRGKDADAAVLSALKTAGPKVKVELIRAVGERAVTTAPAILIEYATDSDRKVRSESIRALRDTAGEEQVRPLLELLLKTEDENERAELERTVAAAIRRSNGASVGELTRAYQSTRDTELQSALLAVMATVGNSASLPAIREAVKSNDADLQRAGINALAAWPSPEPADDLLTIARDASAPGLQVLAIRGYIKVVQIPSTRPPAQTARMLGAALPLAKRPAEKKAVIAAAQRVVAPESLEVVKAAAADPAVAAEAQAAITALERGLLYRKK